MHPMTSIFRLLRTAAATLPLFGAACDDPEHSDPVELVDPLDAPDTTARPTRHGDTATLTSCVVPAPAGVSALVASEQGVVFAVRASASGDTTLLLHRAHGAGCDLEFDEDAPIAASSLLDLDDTGNIYVYPAEAPAPGVVSTMLPEFSHGRQGTVARVDAAGRVMLVMAAGRGIWSFGVEPGGDALWVTACGPTGVFSRADEGLLPSFTPPPGWDQAPAVLTDPRTLWSVGDRSCGPVAAITPDCGYPLVRTTAGGSEEVGTTIVDLGAGFEKAALARCGANVCGVFASAIIIWDDEGNELQTILAGPDLAALSSEHIVQVSGNSLGVYALLDGDAGPRAVFLPRT